MRKFRGGSEQDVDSTSGAAPAAGKRTLTESVQRKAVQRKGDGGGDAASVTSAAEAGLTGASSELPHRAALESGFGVDLSGVRAHTGDPAAQASRAIGAEAYTYGSDVAFATPSPSKDLVAHEVAHVIQQQAGAGPAGGVGSAGDSFEVEADHAASVVAGGGQSDLANSYSPAAAAGSVQRKVVQKYESAEHAMLGDGMTYPCVLNPMELPNHAAATRGELIAFGDFYASYDAIAQAPREETEALIGIIRWEGIWTLARRQKQLGTATGDPSRRTGLETQAEPDDTGFTGGHADHARARGQGPAAAGLLTWSDSAWDAVVGGVRLKDKAQELHAQFSPSWAFFGMNVPMTTFSEDALTVHQMKATLGRRRFRNTNNTLGQDRQNASTPSTTDPSSADPGHLGGDFFDLASNNLSHFAITNWSTWENYHKQVCDRVAANSGDASVRARATIEDSWGCHFLTDAFSAGHVVDKQELMTYATGMMVGMSESKGLSEKGDNKHDTLGNMLTEALQLAFRDDAVYHGWEQGCRNAFDQHLVRYDELELMLTLPRGTQWANAPVTGSVVGNLVATIMGMPWRNNQPNTTPGGDRPGGGRPDNRESFGPGNQPQGEGDYHLGVGNLAALTVHNALNKIGFEATNGANDPPWRMQGDGHLTAATQGIAQKAVDESTRQATSGQFDAEAVRRFMPKTVTINPSWVNEFYADRPNFHPHPDKMAALMRLVQGSAQGMPIQDGAAAVSAQLKAICHAIMEVEFTAPPGEYAELQRQAPSGDGTASMTDTGLNIGFLREFLTANLPRMVPLAYAASSAGDLSSEALEAYKPRDDAGHVLPTGANDFVWNGAEVRFRVNVTGCAAGTYTLGVKVHDQDAGIDYLPSGQLEDAPAGRNDDEVYGRNGEDAEAHWPLLVTVPANVAPGDNGRSYVDATWTLAGRGDANHGEHYIRVFADEACRMVIGRSTPRDSGTTSNPAPLDAPPVATGGDRRQQTTFSATGVDGNAFEWDGNTVRFRLRSNAPERTNDLTVRGWVKQYNKDSGYDFDESGREIPTGFFEPRDDDDVVGGPTLVSSPIVAIDGTSVGQQVVFSAVDNDNDTYIIVFADANCTQPLARSNVQGTNRGRVRNNPPVAAATSATGFGWSGNRLSFAVAPPTAQKVFVKLFDKDGGYDFDAAGNAVSGVWDSDEQYGGVREVPVARGRASVEATGDAAHEDTYAIVYADPGCSRPLGRSNARG